MLEKKQLGEGNASYMAHLTHIHSLIKNIQPLLTGHDVTRGTYYLVLDEMNVLFDIRHALIELIASVRVSWSFVCAHELESYLDVWIQV